MKLFRKSFYRAWLPLAALVWSAAPQTFACATCYGQTDEPMAKGMNWAILTLGLVVGTVLAVFLTFFVYLIRKSEAVEAAQKNVPELTKV